MATQWVLSKISDALAPTVSNTVSTAGSFAGGAVNAVGNSINGVGETINGTIRRYGDGIKDYGNGIMDWTAAGGVRAGTASNPLGLSGTKTGGKLQVTSGHVYRAGPPTNPKSAASKTLMTTNKTAAPQKRIEGGTPKTVAPQKRIGNGTPKKALPAPPGAKPGGVAKKATSSAAPVKKAPSTPLKPVHNAVKTASSPNPGAMRKKPEDTAKKAAGGTTTKPTTVKKSTPAKPNTSSAPKPTTTVTKPKGSGGNPTGAANPLGLSW